MKIASFCIKHKVTTVLAFLLIAVFGVVFYSNLKLSLMPNMEFPAAYVLCTYPGAGPEDVEELVTRPLESCVSTLSGVDTISSNSSENVSMVMITYEDGTDVDNAAIKLREKFDALTLPDGCSDPVIYNFNVNDMWRLSPSAARTSVSFSVWRKTKWVRRWSVWRGLPPQTSWAGSTAKLRWRSTRRH